MHNFPIYVKNFKRRNPFVLRLIRVDLNFCANSDIVFAAVVILIRRAVISFLLAMTVAISDRVDYIAVILAIWFRRCVGTMGMGGVTLKTSRVGTSPCGYVLSFIAFDR